MNLSSRRPSIRYEITFHFIVRCFVVRRGTWRLFENICSNSALHTALHKRRWRSGSIAAWESEKDGEVKTRNKRQEFLILIVFRHSSLLHSNRRERTVLWESDDGHVLGNIGNWRLRIRFCWLFLSFNWLACSYGRVGLGSLRLGKWCDKKSPKIKQKLSGTSQPASPSTLGIEPLNVSFETPDIFQPQPTILLSNRFSKSKT